jgi:ankyrin repeat protein
LLFLLLIALLIAVPLVLTWRVVQQERLNQALITAVKRNDDQAVVSLLDQGADANCRDEPPRKFSLWETLMQIVRGRQSQRSKAPTPLLVALTPQPPRLDIPPENVALVRALLDHGAQVDRMDSDGFTPLIVAICCGHYGTVRLLLAHGARVKGRGRDAEAPLVLAATFSNIDRGVIVDLLDHGAEVNQRDSDGRTALFMAAWAGRTDIVRILLARHADVTVRFEDKTPLAKAMQADRPQSREIVRLLKAAEAKR